MTKQNEKRVLAFGFFDGIHLGHAALMRQAKARAALLGAVPAVLTFDNHPDTFVKGETVPLLNSPRDRAYILKRFFGIDRVYYLHFNAETMHTDWRAFLEAVIEKYGIVHFVVGYDFRFGDRGRGTAALLADYCAAHGLGCDIIPAVQIDGAPVSSTRIRALLEQGELEQANRLLGHPHLLTDTVRTGFRLGRTMEFPTVNMMLEEGVLRPRFGVYAARIQLPDGMRTGVTNIGVRPTFDSSGKRLTVETHIFDYEGDLYGQRLCVEMHAFLRPERPFDSVEALREQIARDAAAARAFFAAE